VKASPSDGSGQDVRVNGAVANVLKPEPRESPPM